MKRRNAAAMLIMLAMLLCAALSACAPGEPQDAGTNDITMLTPEITEIEPPTATPSDGEQDTQGASPAMTVPLVSILFINVGKADAALIRTQERAYLVDTGTKASAPVLLGILNACGVTRLDGVFLTHTHSDHIGGMTAVGENAAVDRMYRAEISMSNKKGGNDIDAIAQALELPLKLLNAGDSVDIGSGLAVEVIAPLEYNNEDDNDNSLVLRLNAAGRSVLLTGDMQFAEEDTLLAANADVKAEVLKVGNHGNPDATSDNFGATVAPKYAVISTNTAEDTDSANPRVIAALGGAQTFVTEQWEAGVLMRISADGGLDIRGVSFADVFEGGALPQALTALSITAIDKQTQTVTISNSGGDADISGYMLYSERGGELFVFPEGARIAAGQTVTVACGSEGDYTWTGEKKVWHMKKDDNGYLYDKYGRILAQKA